MILNVARSVLKERYVPKEFCADAAETAVYIKVRVTCRDISPDTSPIEVWQNSKANVSHLQVFGSRC